MNSIRFDRLRKLNEYMKLVPDALIYLETIVLTTPCGTLCCAFGHAGHMPEFMAEGLRVSKDGETYLDGVHLHFSNAARHFFGVPHAYDLFGSVGDSDYDEKSGLLVRHRRNPDDDYDHSKSVHCSDHRGLFQHRLKCLFAEHGEVL